jgi:hypothetical protein
VEWEEIGIKSVGKHKVTGFRDKWMAITCENGIQRAVYVANCRRPSTVPDPLAAAIGVSLAEGKP